MRVTKKEGQFVVEDEPVRLEGEAARQFIRDMDARDATANTEEHKRFLAECERIYRSAKLG